jgi:hypothetical protein
VTAPSVGSGHSYGSSQTPVGIASSLPGWTCTGGTVLPADAAASGGGNYQLADSGTLTVPAAYSSWASMIQQGRI